MMVLSRSVTTGSFFPFPQQFMNSVVIAGTCSSCKFLKELIVLSICTHLEGNWRHGSYTQHSKYGFGMISSYLSCMCVFLEANESYNNKKKAKF